VAQTLVSAAPRLVSALVAGIITDLLCDNRQQMESHRPKWWVIGIAALLAGMLLYDSLGSWAALAGGLAIIAAFLIYQSARSQAARSGKAASIRCIKCGEPLNPNARRCDSCGSASWTIN
jgi:hypothetical protein